MGVHTLSGLRVVMFIIQFETIVDTRKRIIYQCKHINFVEVPTQKNLTWNCQICTQNSISNFQNYNYEFISSGGHYSSMFCFLKKQKFEQLLVQTCLFTLHGTLHYHVH